jgi:uncharacterized protein GlcG (DUF336 family)
VTLGLDAANSIIRGAFGYAAEIDLKPLAVAVLDVGGHLVAFARQDGVPFGRFEVARGKAYGAIAIGASSRQLGAMAIERPHFIGAVTAALGGALVPVAGGVIVMNDDGVVIGAVGVSGDTSDNDESAALAGIGGAGLRPVRS